MGRIYRDAETIGHQLIEACKQRASKDLVGIEELKPGDTVEITLGGFKVTLFEMSCCSNPQRHTPGGIHCRKDQE